MTLEEAIAIAREHDACDDDLDEIEACGTWAKVLNHPTALFWVRWFSDYLPGPLAYAREDYHEALRAAIYEVNKVYRGTLAGADEREPARDAYDQAKVAASQALLAEIKKYLEIEEPQASLPVNKICAICHHWSKLVAHTEGGKLQALCEIADGPYCGTFTGYYHTCGSWAPNS